MKKAVLMMQKEVAQRILAQPGDKDYGLLTLMIQYYADTRWLMKVSRNCFYPRPDVDSAVVEFLPLDRPRVEVHNQEVFKDFLRIAFQMRRKTILNSSSAFFQISKSQAQPWLEQIGIKPNQRPEELSLQDFARLVNRFLG
jgi:16S rRNA (adenine1518-N6/adenine1519-N6)-dimethyltransferase